MAMTFAASAEDVTLTLASTTSTQNSGLYDRILPMFEAETGIHVNVVAVGTGQALRIARNGDADVLIVHHRPSELKFVAEGYGVKRYDLMYNDFVLVGPKQDPADIRDATSAEDAFRRIAESRSLFISRGDDSGTNKKELELWKATGIQPQGDWYREIGAGMGAALNMVAVTDAYTLSDRGTWLSFGNKQNLDLLYGGDKGLRNPYSVIVVNDKIFPHIKTKAANTFVKWLLSEHGQRAIGAYRVKNQQLFCPHLKAARLPDDDSAICPAD
jgi:tungstate transport system substrate-binding protein